MAQKPRNINYQKRNNLETRKLTEFNINQLNWHRTEVQHKKWLTTHKVTSVQHRDSGDLSHTHSLQTNWLSHSGQWHNTCIQHF